MLLNIFALLGLTALKLTNHSRDTFAYLLLFSIQGVPKNLQSIENNLLLEFQWPSTNLKVKSAKY